MRIRAIIAFAILLSLGVVLLGGHVSAQTTEAQAGQSEHGSSSANGAAHEGDDEHAEFKESGSVKLLSRITGLSMDATYWVAVVLNFVIIAVLIAWASQKNLPAVFRNRTATIQKSLEEARRASEEARQRMQQVEARLSRFDQEIAQMRATSEKEAAAEEERIKASAAAEARHIVESAEQEIAAAAKAARRELTNYAADLAVSLAAKQIHVDSKTDQALVRRFAQQLSENGGPGKKA